MNNAAVHVSQPEISPAVSIRQLGMIYAHQVQDGRMKVVNVGRFLDRLEPIANDVTLGGEPFPQFRKSVRIGKIAALTTRSPELTCF